MAKERTTSSRFQSFYGGGYVTNAQYLTECLCILIAKQEKKDLLDNFWKSEPWVSIFRRQIPLAALLLKEYPVEVLLSAMRDRRCWKMRSFAANWLFMPIVKQKMAEYQVQQSTTTMEKTSTTEKPRKRKPKGSLLSRLKEVDNEQS